MQDSALQLLRITLDDAHLTLFAQRLTDWLLDDLTAELMDSRAKALLRAADVIDAPTLRSFTRLVDPGSLMFRVAVRIALYALLDDTGLAENEEVLALAATSQAAPLPQEHSDIAWFALSVGAFAWHNGYPPDQLDPDSPPGEFSPAGQLLRQTAHFLRQQVTRSATERDKLGRRLAFVPGSSAGRVPTLEEIAEQSEIPPLPPHFRPPIPVSYPEVARETLEVDVSSSAEDAGPVERADPISIDGEDLPTPDAPQRMPPIRITADQIGRESRPASRVVTPPASTPPTNFTRAVRSRFSRSRERFVTTKLRVHVQEMPDGPGLYGLQVRVTCKGVRSYVAGTTNRDGRFLCELPVRVHSGLTYDVDVTWPRDLGGETERKSITLNADRTEFTLPFYRRLR